MGALLWLLPIIGVAGIGIFVVQWIRRATANRVALEQSDASLRAERERRDALEKAAAAARAARAKEMDAAKADVHTADDAAALLRDALSRSRSN